jgi:cysteine desulfurase
MPAPILYLDYNATTPLDPAVIEAMLPWLREGYGNPSSAHTLGRSAREAVEKSRASVAALIGAQPDEVVFTGGGTEASNHALKGVFFSRSRGLTSLLTRLLGGTAHIVSTQIEHPATLQPLAFLRGLGASVTLVPVGKDGVADPDDVRRALTRSTVLVSIMHSNNEVGTLQPVREVAELCRPRGILVHTDAAQSLGKVPVDVGTLGVDLLTLAGHKLYAPKGVGALYVRRGVSLEPLIHGAGHEGGRRAGTENVPHIAALGAACDVARKSLPQASGRLLALRERLWEALQAGLGSRVVLNGHPEKRLPNTLNVSFLGQIGAELLARVPEVAASTGSACHEGEVTRSPVLCAMQATLEVNHGAVRLTVGRFTTEDEVDRAASLLIAAARSSLRPQP